MPSFFLRVGQKAILAAAMPWSWVLERFIRFGRQFITG